MPTEFMVRYIHTLLSWSSACVPLFLRPNKLLLETVAATVSSSCGYVELTITMIATLRLTRRATKMLYATKPVNISVCRH